MTTPSIGSAGPRCGSSRSAIGARARFSWSRFPPTSRTRRTSSPSGGSKTPLAKGQQADFAYRQFWCWSPPSQRPPLAIDRHRAAGRGAARPSNAVFWSNFAATISGRFRAQSAADDVKANLTDLAGKVVDLARLSLAGAQVLRVSSSTSIPASETACEMRLTLEAQGAPISRDLALPMDAVNQDRPDSALARPDSGTSRTRRCRRNRRSTCRSKSCRVSTAGDRAAQVRSSALGSHGCRA